MRSLLLLSVVGLAVARKIGTQDPIKEIFNIFVTLGGVVLFLLALVIYFRHTRLPPWMERLLFGHPTEQLNEDIELDQSTVAKESSYGQSPVVVDYF